MPVRRLILTAISGFIGLAAAAGAGTFPRAPAPALDWRTPCPFEAAVNVDPTRLKCGYLTVPAVADQPEGATVRLPVAVIKTLSKAPKPDPVLFLAGGPGGAPTTSTHSFNLFAGHAFGQDRDIVLFTQRGALSTVPELRCDRLRALRQQIVAEDLSLPERDVRITAEARNCLTSLQLQGIPLHAFSARENARDMLALRRALGVQQWNLLGVSYGTYMALEALRVDPGGVRSMILDSAVSPESDLFMSEASANFERGIERLLAVCESQADCAAAYPGLSSKLANLLETLQEQPPTVMLMSKSGNADFPVVVNDHDFLTLVHWMLYSAKALPMVPQLIDNTEAGDFTLLTKLMNSVYPAPAAGADSAAGAFFAIVCEDQYRQTLPVDPGQGRFGAFAITSFMRDVCSDPGLDYGRAPARQPVASKVPTLILSGKFDPMTPDIYAEQIARHLPNSRLVRLNNWGHSALSGYSECQTDIAAAFLEQPLGGSFPECPGLSKTPQFPTSSPSD